MEASAELKVLKAELRAVRREMREQGIKRTSFLNGGLSRDSSRYNCECFRLENEIKRRETQNDLSATAVRI